MDPDTRIVSWIFEYLIWQPIKGADLGRVFNALPRLPIEDLRFRKLLFLKMLDRDSSTRLISERTLYYLECLEGIETGMENAISDTMKLAFCFAAVDCTVKLLTAGEGGEDERRLKFAEAVERVWRGRIERIEGALAGAGGGLGSDLLWGWRDDMVAAVNDEGVLRRVLSNFEGIGAVEAVEGYVREERERIGPPFLRRVAEGMRRDARLQDILGVDGIHQLGEETDAAAGGEGEGENVPPSPSLSSSS